MVFKKKVLVKQICDKADIAVGIKKPWHVNYRAVKIVFNKKRIQL